MAFATDNKIRCLCNILIKDLPAGQNNTIPDAFKNEQAILTCDDKGLEECRKFCINTEKEKTNGDLTKESKSVKGKNYGQLLCEAMNNQKALNVDKKTLALEAQLRCIDGTTNKKIDTGVTLKDQLTCKDQKFVKA